MIANLIRSEWLKMRTVRVNYVLAGIAVAIPLLIVILASIFGDTGNISGDDFIGLVLGSMVVPALLLGVIASLNLTSEFSLNTIRTTFAATPQRRNVLLVKAFVGAAFSMAFGAVLLAICVFVGGSIVRADNSDMRIESEHWQAMLGMVVMCGLLALFGFALGLLLRNSPAAIVVFILWPLLLEPLLTGLLYLLKVDRAELWLPYNRAFEMVDPLPTDGRWSGGIYFAVVIAILTTVGIVINERRDA